MTTFYQDYDSATDSNALTITLASLATSATFITGRQSTIVTNASNRFIDYLVTGQITVGTSPTLDKEIRIYAFCPTKFASSSFSYPVATTTELGESDAAATFEAYQLDGLRLAAAMRCIATSDREYTFAFSLASLYGGIVPVKWGVFVSHNTAVNLNSTAGNHWIHWTGIKTVDA